MKTNRKILIAVLVVLAVSLLTLGTFAATSYYVKNDVSTGQIDIALYGIDGQKDLGIHPGEIYKSGFSVSNSGYESYVRVKVVALDEKGEVDEELTSLLSLVAEPEDENWQSNGEYLYYMIPMAKDADVTTDVYIKVSKDMGDKYASNSAQVKVQAEAVQTANNPMQESGKPWTAHWENQ